ncbi:alpha/beta hydrolase [Curtobacterium phoenicis]|uniref:alpha/beta hydrolase n=1 Tax=Curtobacterium sp. 1P10AnD TaxID=3132283 RepID=UPI00399F19EA
MAGFRATRTDDLTLNVVGHSYGTTTGADALHGTGVHVDNFVAVASAGIEGDVGGAKGIDADHVYAGQATSGLPTKDVNDNPRDQYAWLGRLGSGRDDPMDSSFGATTFGTNGGDPSEGHQTTMHDPIGYGGGTRVLRLRHGSPEQRCAGHDERRSRHDSGRCRRDERS